jgi:hypothetical protein
MTHISNEALLTSLGYRESMLSQLEAIEKNTPNFDKVIKHLVALNDHLKHVDALVALSSTNDYIKIKSHSANEALIQEFHEETQKWAQKYKADIEQVEGKNTYYLKGVA